MTTTNAQTIAAPLPAADNTDICPSSILIWLAIQLVTIGLVIAQVRLWVRGGDDADALCVLVVAQVAGASIFAPVLARNLRTAMCAVLSALPFLQIAAIVAAADARHLASGAAAVILWATSVTMAIVTARTTLARATIHAIANCISVGGVIVYYLRAEFADSSKRADFAEFGPIASALTLARRGSSSAEIGRAWIALAIVAFIFFAFAISNRVFLIARARRT